MKIIDTLKTFSTAMLLAVGCYTPPASAVDTDLFVREPGTAGTPNVLMIFDNSAAWSQADPGLGNAKRQTIMHEAMHRILTELLSDVGRYKLWDSSKTDQQNKDQGRIKVNLGLLGYTGVITRNGVKRTGASGGTEAPRGGKVIWHMKLLDRDRAIALRNQLYFNQTTKTYQTFANIDADSNGTITSAEYNAVAGNATLVENSGNSAVPNLFMESYQYFSGGQPFAGIQDIGFTQYRDNEGTGGGNIDNNLLDEEAFFANPATAMTSDVPTATYNNDFLDDNACGGNHIMAFLYRIPANESAQTRCHTNTGNGLDQVCGPNTTTPMSPEEALVNYFGYNLVTEVGPNKYIDFTGDGFVTTAAKENQLPDEYAKWLKEGIDLIPVTTDGDQTITTHVVNLNDAPSNANEVTEEKYFQSIATEGGGEYTLADSALAVVDAFFNTLDSILATNAVFASTALPVSVNVRGTNLNQIYLGVFRANEDNRARWWGNLKQYKLGLENNVIVLQDADGNTAQGLDGFIDKDARSLWTRTTAHRTADAAGNTGYWSYSPRGNVSSDALKDEDNPDGEVVEKGSVAQYLRELIDDIAPYNAGPHPATRRVLTCVGTDCADGTELGSTGATLFNAANTNLTVTNLGITAAIAAACSDANYSTVTTDANVSHVNCADGIKTRADTLTRANLINTVIGLDVVTPFNLGNAKFSDVDLDGAINDARPQVHGDVLHSRPAIVNFNRLGDDSDVVVFYGANEGFIHAVQGGDEDHPKDGDASSTGTDPNNGGALLPAGSEIWAFVAEEHFGKLYQQFENDAVDDFQSPRSTANRQLFFDGTFTTLIRDNFNEDAYERAIAAGKSTTDAASIARTNSPAATFGDSRRLIKYDGKAGRDATNDADEVLLFMAARRGGDLIYAFDITDPYNPVFKWRVRGPDAGDDLIENEVPGEAGFSFSDADSGFEELAQTWSAPVPIQLQIDRTGDGVYNGADISAGGPTDVLVFGKGYNPGKDDFEPDAATPDRSLNVNDSTPNLGAGIMIINADTGVPIWQAGSLDNPSSNYSGPGEYLEVPDMIWSIPSDVTAVDRDRVDGLTEKFYVGDTGGNVWRGDVFDPDPAKWTVTKLAALGNHTNNSAYCTGSALTVNDSSLCPDRVCDISGTVITPADGESCPTFVCSDGSTTQSPATDCAGTGGFTCNNSGASVSDPADCPDFFCADTVVSQNAWVQDTNTCQVVCTPASGAPYLRNRSTNLNHALNRNCNGNGPNKDPARLQNNIKQEGATAVGAPSWTVETDSPEPANLVNGDDDRRFLFPPDVVPNSDPAFDAVLLGSGDRELPDSTFVEDRFYMLKDFWVPDFQGEKDIVDDINDQALARADGVISPDEQDHSDFDTKYPTLFDDPTDTAASSGLDNNTVLYNATNNTIQTGDTNAQTIAQDALDDASGWFINLIGPTAVNTTDDDDSTTQLGEKVVSASVTLGGTVFFNTNEPTSTGTSCASSLGTARAYAINYLTGAVPDSVTGTNGQLTDRFQVLAAGGFPPSPVPFVIDFDGEIRSGVQIGPIPIQSKSETYNQRQRVFWFQDIDLQ